MSDLDDEGSGKGWVEFQLAGPLAALEVFADFMDELGAGGAVFSEDPFGGSNSSMVTVFLGNDKADQETMDSIRSRAGELKHAFKGEWRDLAVTRIEDKDWADEWKKSLKPERFEPGIWIVPSFLDPPDEAKDEPVIRIDPGMAFGTGNHATTRECVRMVGEQVRSGARSVLDIGTGTGVLAMVAVILGAERVLAMEVDPIALKTAENNIRENGLADRIEVRPGAAEPDTRIQGAPFDLVAANIFAESLFELLPFIERSLAPSGHAVLSGILVDRGAEVVETAAKSDMKVEKRIEEEGWLTLLLRKRSGS